MTRPDHFDDRKERIQIKPSSKNVYEHGKSEICNSYKIPFLFFIFLIEKREENKEHLAYTVAIPPCAIPSVKR